MTVEDTEQSCSPQNEINRKDIIGSCTSESTKIEVEDCDTSNGNVDQEPKFHEPHVSLFQGEQVIWVDWDKNDPENPQNWSKIRKWLISILLIIYSLLSSIAGSVYPISIEEMQQEFNNTRILSNLGVSLYPFGFGLPPLILAPVSEVYGRNATYLPSLFLFVVFFLIIALAPNIGSVIAGRFLCGAAASAGSTMVSGSLADIWESGELGIPMAIFSVVVFVGMGVGPLFGGWVSQYAGWRWNEWITMSLAGLLLVAFCIFLKESRGSVLLSRRAAKLRKSTGDKRYQCRSDYERSSLLVMIKKSFSRPLVYLFTEPVVTAFSLWIGFTWGLMWALLPAMSLVFRNVYHFNTAQLGNCYVTLFIGPVFGALFLPIQERVYAKRVQKDGPEARLYASLIGGLMIPIGAFIFGWSQGRGHWMGPLVGASVLMCGNYTIYLAIHSYLADAYTLYASSAIAAQSLARNLGGFAFPLFTDTMYNNLGYSWAPTLVALISLVLAACPYILLIYGPKLRSKSKALTALEQDLKERRQQQEENHHSTANVNV